MPRNRALVVYLLVFLVGCDARTPDAKDAKETKDAKDASPRECGGQPCCGDPPRPCGEVIDSAKGRACTTACDCEFPGLACNEGKCASGTEAVFCCDACPKHVPAAQGCQHPDGRFATCGTP